MKVAPIVRYMILCDDWELDPTNHNRVNIFGLMSYVTPLDVPPYPLLHPKLCVFLALTEMRGEGKTHVRCVFEETGEVAFRTAERDLTGKVDPLSINAVIFHIEGGTFPRPGMYSVQFWYNDAMVHECALLLRSQP